jgi:hypothetical protein
MNDTELRRSIERFKVCWETFPEMAGTNHARHPIGFSVELFGTHDRSDIVPTAGCKDCIPVLQALLGIADAVVPDEWRDAVDRVRAHSGIEYATERGGRPDIVVTITMIPQRDRPPDPSAMAECRRAVTDRLRALGASERSWRAPPVSALQGPSSQRR